MKVLIYDSIAATPHCETSMELCIKESLLGSEVYYFPAFIHAKPQIWRSNVNGNKSSGSSDESWWRFITKIISKFASVVDIASVFGSVTPIFSRDCIQKLMLDDYVKNFSHSHLDVALNNEDNPQLPIFSNAIRSQVMSSWLVARLVIEHTCPDLVYVFNGRNPESWPVFRFTTTNNIKCLFHERGSTIGRYELFEKPPAYVEAWQRSIEVTSPTFCNRQRDINAAVFFRRQRLGKLTNFAFSKRTSAPSYDFLKRIPERFALFLSSSNYECYSIPDPDYWNALGNQEHAVLSLLNVCERLGLPLVIRQHPNSGKFDMKQFDDYKSHPLCVFFAASDEVSSYSLAEKAQACFTVGSTITWELVNMGVRCATLARSIGSGQEGVYELSSEEEIERFLASPSDFPIDTKFTTRFGDYMSKYGHDFSFFEAASEFTGTFDVDLINML